MFSCVYNGFSEIYFFKSSPTCFGADCKSSEFDSVSALIKHVSIDHIANQDWLIGV